jgi:hypothetical protein
MNAPDHRLRRSERILASRGASTHGRRSASGRSRPVTTAINGSMSRPSSSRSAARPSGICRTVSTSRSSNDCSRSSPIRSAPGVSALSCSCSTERDGTPNPISSCRQASGLSTCRPIPPNYNRPSTSGGWSTSRSSIATSQQSMTSMRSLIGGADTWPRITNSSQLTQAFIGGPGQLHGTDQPNPV